MTSGGAADEDGDGVPVGVVLAGGASRRMGRDKAAVVVDGRPMVVSVADALRSAGCHPIVCQGGDAAVMASFGLEVVPDGEPGAGPVAAIHDALARFGVPVVISACDLPDLVPDVVRALISAGRAADVAVATTGGHRQMLSYWSPAALPGIVASRADGVDSYRVLLGRCGAVEVPVAARIMRNVNGPDDLG